jgi:hypothetical protein
LRESEDVVGKMEVEFVSNESKLNQSVVLTSVSELTSVVLPLGNLLLLGGVVLIGT